MFAHNNIASIEHIAATTGDAILTWLILHQTNIQSWMSSAITLGLKQMVDISQRYFEMNSLEPQLFILIPILLKYIFKDRIKQITNHYLD